jgi:hypothetical protein
MEKLHSKEHRKLYSLPGIRVIRMVDSRSIDCQGTYHGYLGYEGHWSCRLLVGKPEGKRLLGRPRHKLVDNIKMDPGDI